MSGNAVKAELLGMPFGTANGRLRKLLLFSYAQRLGLDVCYQCGGRIVSVEDFSIEHTVPWMSAENPSETFFDLNTILHSHLKCNVAAAERLKVYRDVAHRNKEEWDRYYAKNSEDILARKRRRYHLSKGGNPDSTPQ